MMAFAKAEQQELLRFHSEYELKTPLPQKQLGDRTIYLSHNKFGPLTHGIGRPVIVDLYVAMPEDVEKPWDHDIQPHNLQAPEVVIGAPWSYSADVWDLGALLLYLMEGHDLSRRGKDDVPDLTRMISCLGPPPEELLRRRIRNTGVLDDDGKLKVTFTDGSVTLESFVTLLEGDEKVRFLSLIRRMLEWVPEERATAKELLEDARLRTDT